MKTLDKYKSLLEKKAAYTLKVIQDGTTEARKSAMLAEITTMNELLELFEAMEARHTNDQMKMENHYQQQLTKAQQQNQFLSNVIQKNTDEAKFAWEMAMKFATEVNKLSRIA